MKKITTALQAVVPTENVGDIQQELENFHKAYILFVEKLIELGVEKRSNHFIVEETTKEKEFREEAIKWWNSLPGEKKWEVSEGIRDKFRPPVGLTGREIEAIYRHQLLNS